MGWLSDAFSGSAGGIIGGAMGLFGSKESAKKSQKEAARNRAFQQQMSDTAHQREMVDLRAAGAPGWLGIAGMLLGKMWGNTTGAKNTPKVHFKGKDKGQKLPLLSSD